MTTTSPIDARPLDAQCVADVSERLMVEYETRLPLSAVTGVVLDAHRDLAGQVPATALAELLERLARYRLDRMVTAAG